MKKLKSLAKIALVMSISSGVCAQHDYSKTHMKQDDLAMMDPTSNMVKLSDKNLTKAYMHYTMINEALVEADSEKAQNASKILVSILNQYGKAPDAKKVAAKMASMDNFMNQRIVFAELTTVFEP